MAEHGSKRSDARAAFDYAVDAAGRRQMLSQKFKENTVKGSQFKQPLLEFSGACAGCGETPYAKLITQLFGDRMYIANATGCSSIWGNSSPSTPYTVNEKGQGPAWSNSLFEDNAEFGYGMLLAQNAIRDGLKAKVEALVAGDDSGRRKGSWSGMAGYLRSRCYQWHSYREADRCSGGMRMREGSGYPEEQRLTLAKKSQWIFGGDGWAYDIGFGGVDHVLASGKDINIMVFDTEVYSNTGGQSSKSTQTGCCSTVRCRW